ncbi:hypothetical protein Hdeb2414_s0007g00243371 [Helianthus debilis subsp. tardiflorus]
MFCCVCFLSVISFQSFICLLFESIIPYLGIWLIPYISFHYRFTGYFGRGEERRINPRMLTEDVCHFYQINMYFGP